MLEHGFERTLDEEVIDYVSMARDLNMNAKTFLRNIAIILAGDEWELVGTADWEDVRDILIDHPELIVTFEAYIGIKLHE